MATREQIKLWRRRIGRVTAMAAMVVYFPLTMSFVNAERAATTCEGVVTKINNSSDNVLITEKGLGQIIRANFPDLEGMPLSEMNLHEMEQIIEKTPVVKRCEIYPTMGGVLHVEISQREPIMRVFTSGTSYYMDATSFRMTAKGDMRATCVVVNGNVGALLEAQELIDMCNYINSSKFWRAQIEQIYVTDRCEFVLVPRVGDHIVEFGGIDNMVGKFESLYALYTRGWQPLEWNLYKKISLKYKGQIVCTKK